MAPKDGDVALAARATDPEVAMTLRHLVTGNRLRDGIPVYFTHDAGWSPRIEDAQHVGPEAAERLLAEAQSGGPAHPVVAPYLIEATLAEGRLTPASLREHIRAFGPTTGLPR
jgi:hypothetical protein